MLLTVQAQPAPAKAIALYVQGQSLLIGEIALSSDTNFIAFSAANRYARVDGIGLALFVPPGGPEGVYTFAPYRDGWTAETAEKNILRAREAVLSPDGNQFAVRLEADVAPQNTDGVWFWQPARDLPTDPAYHILPHCPPCTPNAVVGDNWRSTSIEWSSDNQALLIGVELREEGRRALEIRYATRDVRNQQAQQRLNPLRYEFGHWAADGQNIVVSGTDPNNQVSFGIVGRDGALRSMQTAADIGMAWVQDAVQTPDGRLLLLASPNGRASALQIVDGEGKVLTQPIGIFAPTFVRWNAERDAVLLRTGRNAYVALTNGIIYDISAVVGDVAAINWATEPPLNGFTLINAPAPVVTAPPAAPTPSLLLAHTPLPTTFQVGQLLAVTVNAVPVYSEPVEDAAVVATLAQGAELILTAGPLTDGRVIWWRVQTLDAAGWLIESRDGAPVLQATQ
jgi:hypothetical protein